MNKIKALRINGKINKELLIELATDPDLINFQIICHWKDETTCGWNTGITDGELIFGNAVLHAEVNKFVFGN